jgi:diguanylate cyclase (GGDEF)-like protein/PAS domain S-box-containing protein
VQRGGKLGFELLKAGLAPNSLLGASAAIVALCFAAVVHYVVNTGLLSALLALKRREPLGLIAALRNHSWMGAVSLASALVAALLVASGSRLGWGSLLVISAAVLLVFALLQMSFQAIERERQGQEARIADAERESLANQRRFAAAFSHATGGLVITDKGGMVLRVNTAFADLVGRPSDAVTGESFRSFFDGEHWPDLASQAEAVSSANRSGQSLELPVRSRQGVTWVSVHVSSFEDPGEAGPVFFYQVHDISDRRAAQERLQFAAYHDGLTSLPNRLAFLQGLQAAIDRSKVDPTATFATLLLDLDRFKMVNDSLGHAAGNELLVEVARRLSSSVRPGDSVARLGGDEFGLMFDRIGSQQEAVSLAQRVVDTIVQPMQIGGSEFTVQCSIGLTLSDLGHRSADEMIRDADIAMYDAKGKGRGRISVFDTPMHDYVADRLYMEAELRRAISAGQITLVYQPIVMLPQRRLLGFEALARWHHPEMGMVDVPKFIVLAEESGFISQLTPWVIEMASLQMAAWQRVLPDGERLKMHVNISARDLELPGFTTSVATGLARARLSGHALTLEITETSLMRSMEHALPVMESLRRIGVGFSIDDFGTGYSSLSYLSALPIDSLKIDRSFVLGMDRGPQNVEIVRAILRLGQTLHMHVIAEGVETHEHLDALRDIGVEAGQGYLFSRPLPPAKMLEQLQLAGLQPG